MEAGLVLFVYMSALQLRLRMLSERLVSAHDCTPGTAGGQPPCWNFVAVGQLGPSVNIVGLLAHGQHQGVLLAAVVGPEVKIIHVSIVRSIVLSQLGSEPHFCYRGSLLVRRTSRPVSWRSA